MNQLSRGAFANPALPQQTSSVRPVPRRAWIGLAALCVTAVAWGALVPIAGWAQSASPSSPAAPAAAGVKPGTFPQRPVKIIVAFPAGGGTDIAARIRDDSAKWARLIKEADIKAD